VKLRRFLGPLLIAFVVLLALLFGVAWIPVEQARAAWRAGRDADALSLGAQWSRTTLWAPQWQQMLAVANLSAGNDASARPHLAAMRNLWPPAVGKNEVIRRLTARGRYAAVLEYEAADRSRASAEVLLDEAGAAAALGRIDLAARTLRAVDRARVDPHRWAAVNSAIEQRRAGTVPWVFDRFGGVIAVARTAGGEVAAVDHQIALAHVGEHRLHIDAAAERVQCRQHFDHRARLVLPFQREVGEGTFAGRARDGQDLVRARIDGHDRAAILSE